MFAVQTSDNVKLNLEGHIFWQIQDVPKMFANTNDPKGDVWKNTRRVLNEVVSKVRWSVITCEQTFWDGCFMTPACYLFKIHFGRCQTILFIGISSWEASLFHHMVVLLIYISEIHLPTLEDESSFQGRSQK